MADSTDLSSLPFLSQTLDFTDHKIINGLRFRKHTDTYLNKYYICENGNVFDECFNEIIVPPCGKITKSIQISRAVAELFIANPHNLPYVHFKDGDNENRNMTNLEWSSEKNDIECPEYVIEDFGEYRVHSWCPQFKIFKNGDIFKGAEKREVKPSEHGNITVHTNFKKNVTRGKIVMDCWGEKQPEGHYLHHIDGDNLNDNVDNLKWVTMSELKTVPRNKKDKSKDDEKKEMRRQLRNAKYAEIAALFSRDKGWTKNFPMYYAKDGHVYTIDDDIQVVEKDVCGNPVLKLTNSSGVQKTVQCKVYVMEAFFGYENRNIEHIDSNKYNNVPSNLHYVDTKVKMTGKKRKTPEQ